MAITLLRLPDVLRRRGRCRASHYADISDGLMVPPVPIGVRARAYPAHEVEAIIAALVRGATRDEIRALVRDLIAARQNAA